MNLQYLDFRIEIVDDPIYSLNSTDNISNYDQEYFDDKPYSDRNYSNSKHGIRVFKNDLELSSAIICEVGGATTIHENSCLIKDGLLFICCSDKIYALSLPDLKLKWKKRLDPATCFGIYSFQGDLVVHGELQITRVDINGIEKWSFGARDIFVT
jgi:hypothetical protein